VSEQTAGSGRARQTRKTQREEDPADNGGSEESETRRRPTSQRVETAEERRTRLDRELDATLREFDELVLREQKLVEESRQSEETSSSSGGGGGGGDMGSGETGEERASSRSEGGSASEGRATTPTGGSSEGGAGRPGASGPASAGGPGGRGSAGRTPPDVGDGHDDDIVARQLREAAQNEENPALREKLWDEYRAYKRGTDGS